MNPTFIWLSISLFCGKNNWNKLLGDGIGPFVASIQTIEDYTIEFNYLSGENIRLSLRVNKDDAPVVAKCADDFFKRYFSVANFPVKDVQLPVDGVFMPMPMNTIQYGLYNIPAKIQVEISDLTHVSEILITALKDDSIDDETIITFAFYLQVGLIKVLIHQIKNAVDLMFIINPAEQGVTAMEEEVTLDMALLHEITLDIMQTEKFDTELNWLNTWIQINNRAFQTFNKYHEYLEHFYYNKISVIYKCLGLNNNCQLLLTNSIQSALSQYFVYKNYVKI